MSWEEMSKNEKICPCRKGKVVEIHKMDDWNRSKTFYSIECDECSHKYDVTDIRYSENGIIKIGIYLTPKDYPGFQWIPYRKHFTLETHFIDLYPLSKLILLRDKMSNYKTSSQFPKNDRVLHECLLANKRYNNTIKMEPLMNAIDSAISNYTLDGRNYETIQDEKKRFDEYSKEKKGASILVF